MSPKSRNARGRVGADPAAELRERLIDAAEKLLAERQVATITTRDIARMAGLSDGVLYNYFSDKTELLIAALLRRYAAALDRFGADLPAPGTATVEQNLLAYAQAAVDLVATTLPIAAGLMSEPVLLHRFIAEIHGDSYGPHRLSRPIVDYLLAEQRLGRLGDFDPHAALSLFMGSALSLGFGGLVGGHSPQDLGTQLPAIVKTLLHGLRPAA